MKHTPGPWKYSLNVGPTKALVVEGDGSTVLEICNRTYSSRFHANVRLATAAPALLEALNRIAELTPQPVEVFDIAIAAIAKAEGGAA